MPRESEYNPAAVMALQEGVPQVSLPIKGYSWIYPFDIVKDKYNYQLMISKAIVTYATFASETTGIPLENLTVIPLRPYDVNLTTVNWQVSLSNTGSSSPNLMLGSSGFSVPNNEFLVLLGMFDSTPDMLVDELYIVRGQAKLYDVQLDMLQPLPSSARFALFNKAFYFKPNDTFNIGLIAHSTGTEYLGLLGLLFTQNGQVITLS
jgi:hypothetical protein